MNKWRTASQVFYTTNRNRQSKSAAKRTNGRSEWDKIREGQEFNLKIERKLKRWFKDNEVFMCVCVWILGVGRSNIGINTQQLQL